MKGKLSHSPALVLAHGLARAGGSGVLILRRGQSERRLFFVDGILLRAASNLKRHQPADWADSVPAEVSERDRQAAALRLLQREIALDALLWVDGDYEVDQSRPADLPTPTIGMDTSVLLIEATRAAPGQVHERLIGSLDRFQAGASASGLEEHLEPAERSLLRSLARPCSFAQICAAAGGAAPAEIRRLLAVLLAGGLIPAAAAAPDRSRAAASRVPEPAIPPAGTPIPTVDPELLSRLEAAEAGAADDYYGLLGTHRTADTAAIRSAYYCLARRFHPDVLRDVPPALRERADAYFALVTEAYNVLTHAGERAEYDARAIASKSRPESGAPDSKALARQNYEAGRRQQSAGKLHDASQFFANAVRLDDSKPEYHRELGIVQMQNPRGRQLAEESLRRARDLAPADARTLIHLGLLYKRTGRSGLARGMFKETLRWDPENAVALAELAGGEPPPEGGILKGLFGRR